MLSNKERALAVRCLLMRRLSTTEALLEGQNKQITSRCDVAKQERAQLLAACEILDILIGDVESFWRFFSGVLRVAGERADARAYTDPDVFADKLFREAMAYVSRANAIRKTNRV